MAADDLIAKLDKLGDDERVLITKIARTWLAKGEQPSVVAGHVKAWVNKYSDEGASNEGSKPPEDQRDPAEQLEELVDAYVEANPNVKRSRAYGHVLHARPHLNTALARQRDVKLHKAAQAFSDGYGVCR